MEEQAAQAAALGTSPTDALSFRRPAAAPVELVVRRRSRDATWGSDDVFEAAPADLIPHLSAEQVFAGRECHQQEGEQPPQLEFGLYHDKLPDRVPNALNSFRGRRAAWTLTEYGVPMVGHTGRATRQTMVTIIDDETGSVIKWLHGSLQHPERTQETL